MGNCCSGAKVSYSLACVVGALVATGPLGSRLARPDVHGYGSGRGSLVASLLLVFAG